MKIASTSTLMTLFLTGALAGVGLYIYKNKGILGNIQNQILGTPMPTTTTPDTLSQSQLPPVDTSMPPYSPTNPNPFPPTNPNIGLNPVLPDSGLERTDLGGSSRLGVNIQPYPSTAGFNPATAALNPYQLSALYNMPAGGGVGTYPPYPYGYFPPYQMPDTSGAATIDYYGTTTTPTPASGQSHVAYAFMGTKHFASDRFGRLKDSAYVLSSSSRDY
jgi:hypothetical protein